MMILDIGYFISEWGKPYSLLAVNDHEGKWKKNKEHSTYLHLKKKKKI